MEFYELGSYKEKILNQLHDSNDIMNLVTECYDIPFVPSIMAPEGNVICVDSYITKANGSALKEVGIDLYIILHKDHLAFTESDKAHYEVKGYCGNPADTIIQAIGKLLNGSRDFGIGTLKPVPLNPVKPYFPGGNYCGKILSYTCSDFMKNFR